jgi:SecD/SecF fusion protein
MNNKGFIQFITVLLILASIYQLSFTFVTNSVEKKAAAIAADFSTDEVLRDSFERRYLDSISQQKVYPGLA